MSSFQCFVFLKKGEKELKNGKLLYCHYKIIKGSGISFQSPVLKQKHWKYLSDCKVVISIWSNFILILLTIQKKKTKHKCNFRYPAMSIMTSKIWKSVDFTKTQKSR